MKTKKRFHHIADLVKERREANHLSQVGLSELLGYKNGQFISNIERGLCSIPYEKMATFCTVTNTTPSYLKSRMLQDEFDHLENCFPETVSGLDYVSFL